MVSICFPLIFGYCSKKHAMDIVIAYVIYRVPFFFQPNFGVGPKSLIIINNIMFEIFYNKFNLALFCNLIGVLNTVKVVMVLNLANPISDCGMRDFENKIRSPCFHSDP